MYIENYLFVSKSTVNNRYIQKNEPYDYSKTSVLD